MKSVLLLGQIMFYLRIFNFQAQLGTRGIQKFDFKKVFFTSKKLKFMILDRLPKQPTIPYRACMFVTNAITGHKRGICNSGDTLSYFLIKGFVSRLSYRLRSSL